MIVCGLTRNGVFAAALRVLHKNVVRCRYRVRKTLDICAANTFILANLKKPWDQLINSTARQEGEHMLSKRMLLRAVFCSVALSVCPLLYGQATGSFSGTSYG